MPWSARRSGWTARPLTLAVLLFGLWLFGMGEAALVNSSLGNTPWTVLAEGIANHSRLDIGGATILVSVIVLLGWIPLRQLPALGTLANVVVIGVSLDVMRPLLPHPDAVPVRALEAAGGIVTIGVASAFYLTANLGPGPRDGWMTGIHRRLGYPIASVRLTIELTVLAVGVVLGGTVGVATVAFALFVGYCLAWTLQLFARQFGHRPAVSSVNLLPRRLAARPGTEARGGAAATLALPVTPPGGDPMNENPKWQVARLDEIERRGRDIPVREHFGIHAFGVNAYTPGENGTLIGEHDEAGSGQEELYLVLDGAASFEVDGRTFDAPAGTFVSVPPESRRKATGEGTVLAIGATPGQAYRGIDWGDAWQFHSESMNAYGEGRYADALEAVRSGLEHAPDHPGLHYNYACFATLAGDTGDETFVHLKRSVELFPPFREQARSDTDFEAVRGDPRFEDALR